jgi:hypothetical protein
MLVRIEVVTPCAFRGSAYVGGLPGICGLHLDATHRRPHEERRWSFTPSVTRNKIGAEARRLRRAGAVNNR